MYLYEFENMLGIFEEIKCRFTTKQIKVYLNNSDSTFKPAYPLFNQKRESRYYFDKYTVDMTQKKLQQEPIHLEQRFGYRYNKVIITRQAPLTKPIVPLAIVKSGLSRLFISKLLVLEGFCDKYVELEWVK